MGNRGAARAEHNECGGGGGGDDGTASDNLASDGLRGGQRGRGMHGEYHPGEAVSEGGETLPSVPAARVLVYNVHCLSV